MVIIAKCNICGCEIQTEDELDLNLCEVCFDEGYQND